MGNNFVLKPIKAIKNGDISLASFNCIPADIEDSDKYENSISDYKLINEFLKTKALRYSNNNIMQTFLLISADNNKVVGFFTLNASSQRVFKKFRLTKKKQNYSIPSLRRNTELPTVDMVWMGIDSEYQCKGYGQELIEQIFLIIADISNIIGITLFSICSIKDSQSYFKKFGFINVNDGIGNTKGDQFMAITIEELKYILAKSSPDLKI